MSDIAWTVTILLISHYIGDWLCQPRSMALQKSSNIWMLMLHVSIVTTALGVGITIAGLCGFYYIPYCGGLLVLNAIIHAIIDWNMWGGYKARISEECNFDTTVIKKYAYWNDKRFYDRIGFDQMLHLITLAVLFL